MLTDTADKARATDNPAPKIDLVEEDGARRIRLSGRWVSQSVNLVDDRMRSLENADEHKATIIDVLAYPVLIRPVLG